METLTQRLSPGGLLVPPELLEGFGFRPGDEIAIELQTDRVVIRPAEISQEEIENRALNYLLDHVGDATTVQVEQQGDRWIARVMLPHHQKVLGQLVFSRYGVLMPQESSPAKHMIEVASAA